MTAVAFTHHETGTLTLELKWPQAKLIPNLQEKKIQNLNPLSLGLSITQYITCWMYFTGTTTVTLEVNILSMLKLLQWFTEANKTVPWVIINFFFCKIRSTAGILIVQYFGTELAAQSATRDISCAREEISGSFNVFI